MRDYMRYYMRLSVMQEVVLRMRLSVKTFLFNLQNNLGMPMSDMR